MNEPLEVLNVIKAPNKKRISERIFRKNDYLHERKVIVRIFSIL